ncbi:hypothetical protein CRE_26810 [Caenorhabditis remanei]|uniref:DNA-directed DNA polymerase n=1 Tax=Caenorhabditis remanei TaxID=31234 RepID=E3NGC8_CAERE|nr:hypothetical protein CRE_26810 [Caenorhabditis remanei]
MGNGEDKISLKASLLIGGRHQIDYLLSSSASTSAMHIAAMTTSHARLHLYRLMEKVGPDNLVYTDTDSLIYTVADGEVLKGRFGQIFGRPDQRIERQNEGISLKAKGFTMTSVANKIVTFDNMKTMVEEVLKEVTPRTIQKVPQFTMRRDREHNVYARDIEKQMKKKHIDPKHCGSTEYNFDVDSKICIWYYDTFESAPDSMKNQKDIILREGLPNLDELMKYKKYQDMVVIDDLMTKIDQKSGMEWLITMI